MGYKWCIVPQCVSTSIKTPEKMFVSIPKNIKIRNKWLMLAHRNPKDISPSTNVFMCEDHFNMEQEMVNYRQYKMGFSQTILMVEGTMPSKFNCQENLRKRLSDTTLSQTAYIKCLKTETRGTQAAAASTLNDDKVKPENAVEIILGI